MKGSLNKLITVVVLDRSRLSKRKFEIFEPNVFCVHLYIFIVFIGVIYVIDNHVTMSIDQQKYVEHLDDPQCFDKLGIALEEYYNGYKENITIKIKIMLALYFACTMLYCVYNYTCFG